MSNIIQQLNFIIAKMDIHNWIHVNKETTAKIFSFTILIMGILFILGAIKDWDWLYKPDEYYQSKWSLGQASRYWGRKTSRIIGFISGVLFTIIGIGWVYFTCIK